MNYQLTINQAGDFVRKYMYAHDNPNLVYHSILHTENIVSVTNQIAKQYPLSDKELFIVTAAAWFLHIGYDKDIADPLEKSIKISQEFFKNSDVDEEVIELIKKCILATKHPSTPHTLLEEIICDADSFYIGTEKFSEYNKLKRKEFELLNNTKVDKDEWRKSTIQLLESHQYYTDYCNEHLNANKKGNLEKLRKKDQEMNPPVNPITSLLENKSVVIEKSEKKNKEKKKEDKKDSGRTIETMFRTTSTNGQRLSNQADAKAHIMISVNAIVISVLLSLVVRRMDEYASLTIPVLMLLIVNLLTIIFSILATRPNIPTGIFKEEDLKEHKVNLLFFGNFFKMNFDKYSDSMLHVMEDKKVLYLNLLRNLHEQGIVLSKKYRRLKTAYDIFMYGLILSVIAFFIASAFFSR